MATEPGYDQRNLMLTHTLSYNGDNPQLQAEYLYDGDGNRVQQTDFTGATPVMMSYINDVAGLAQVLVMTDGETQTVNLFGPGLVGQDDGSGFRTLLADGLGSVRSEIVNGEVMAATTYDPFGNLLDERGHSSTTFGYTGEQFDDVTGLLYLRARYYNPGLHTFMGKDPWSGNPGKPQSMNGWSYVDNNPINWTDPSGRTPFRAQHCIDSAFFYPDDYANCVRQVYGLNTGWLENADHGYPFLGGPWCWYGPVPYRAPGYIEGASGSGAIFAGETYGREVVYDFATMQRERFEYNGVIFQNGVGTTISAYIGEVRGLRTSQFGHGYSDKQFEEDYGGLFAVLAAGIGLSPDFALGPSISGGISFFASPTAPSVNGYAYYAAAGLSLNPDPFPFLKLEGVVALTTYYPIRESVVGYASDGEVKGFRVWADILNGTDSPWLSLPGMLPVPYDDNAVEIARFAMADSALRTLFIVDKVSKFVDAFNQIHYDSYIGQ